MISGRGRLRPTGYAHRGLCQRVELRRVRGRFCHGCWLAAPPRVPWRVKFDDGEPGEITETGKPELMADLAIWQSLPRVVEVTELSDVALLPVGQVGEQRPVVGVIGRRVQPRRFLTDVTRAPVH